jgi:hypothetical protein
MFVGWSSWRTTEAKLMNACFDVRKDYKMCTRFYVYAGTLPYEQEIDASTLCGGETIV